jgi:hypothetical protein
VCFYFVENFWSETFLIPRIIQRNIVINLYSSSVFLSGFNKFWIFSRDFSKVLKYKVSWKHFQWELTCSMWTDIRTDRQTNNEANSRFRSSVNDVAHYILRTYFRVVNIRCLTNADIYLYEINWLISMTRLSVFTAPYGLNPQIYVWKFFKKLFFMQSSSIQRKQFASTWKC